MNFYFAPLEGITGYVFRNAHKACFPEVNKYFSPFIVATQSESFKSRELNDILPENNQDIALVPQLLTNNSKDFICSSKIIKQMGYDEVNLNLGCPSGTVVSKYRGSGFLSKREELDAFLDDIFSQSITKISVKTRIGKDSPDEFYKLIEIFNKYPITELIIHPRIQKDYYKNKPNLTVLKDALVLSKNPICYNGDITNTQNYTEFTEKFPNVESIMIGRGLIINPGLISILVGNTTLKKETLKRFHDRVYEDYKKILFGEKNVLFKMKEIWSYMILLFPDNEKLAKRIRKAESLSDYDSAVLSLFRDREISEVKGRINCLP